MLQKNVPFSVYWVPLDRATSLSTTPASLTLSNRVAAYSEFTNARVASSKELSKFSPTASPSSRWSLRRIDAAAPIPLLIWCIQILFIIISTCFNWIIWLSEPINEPEMVFIATFKSYCMFQWCCFFFRQLPERVIKFFGPASQIGLARCSMGFTTNYRSVFIISIGMTVICEQKR